MSHSDYVSSVAIYREVVSKGYSFYTLVAAFNQYARFETAVPEEELVLEDVLRSRTFPTFEIANAINVFAALQTMRPTYSALLMVLLRLSDTDNTAEIQRKYPYVFQEARARYNAPGGFLADEVPF